MTRVDVYKETTERILDALGRGTVPWKKPWKSTGLPVNVRNGRPYRGINVLLLGLSRFSDPRWGTFKAVREAAVIHARSEGREIIVEQVYNKRKQRMEEKVYEIVDGEKTWFSGGVRKGEKGTEIILWKKVRRKEEAEGEDPGSYLLLRTYSVFNAEQCDGLAPLFEDEEREFSPIARAEEIVDNYVLPVGSGPMLTIGGNEAVYVLPTDTVCVPKPEQFFHDERYYGALFHELVHSTGHEKRLARIESTLFGSDPYAREELVAEMGASFLAGVAGIDIDADQSASYISGWMKAIAQDDKLVVNAAASAQRACDLILGTTFEENDESGKELVAA